MLLRAISLGLCIAALGGTSEDVCLKSGFCLHAEAHTQSGQTYHFRMGSGEIDLQSSEVVSIEPTPGPSQPYGPDRRASGGPPAGTKYLVEQAAAAQGLDPDFVRSVAIVESAFRTDAVSNKGALGLMQLMPATARGLGVDPRMPTENALGGAKYLRALLLKYHSNSALALAAYNAGPGAVQKFGGVPPYAETIRYIRSVTREYDRLHRAGRSAKPKAE